MFQYTITLRRPRVANFADTTTSATMFIKTTFKDSKNVNRVRTYALKYNLAISVFFDITKVSDFRCKNADVSTTQEMCHVIYIFFGSALGKI